MSGERYSARQLADALCVSHQSVLNWIHKGWLRASPSLTRGFMIRRKAVRRLLVDFPSVARTVANAQVRYWRAWHKRQAELARPPEE